MILSKKFYKTSALLKRLILSRKMKKNHRHESFFSSLSLVQVNLPQFFFYSPRLKTVPRFSGNLQLLSNWPELNLLSSVCPTMAIRVSDKAIDIDETKCIACGLCVEFSPEGLFLTGITELEKRSLPGS